MNDARIDLSESEHAGPSFWDEKPLLQKIVSIAPNVLYVFNQKTQENEFINGSIGAFLGYARDDLAKMGAEFMPLICHPGDLPKVHAHFERIQSIKDGQVMQIEYRMKHKDGHWRWMLSHDAIFDRDAEGNVLRLIGVATDITNRKEAEETAVAEKRAADAANDELRSFAYSVSHDMKAPTNTLKLLLAELEGQNGHQLDDEGRELISYSLDMVHRMQTLVEDVLGYTRVIGSEAAFEEVDLAAMLASMQKTLTADIKAAGARLEIGALPKVQGNPVQLRVYLQNIIGNALKYKSPDRDLVVKVQDMGASTGARVSISISDNGLGIAPENHERIFGMFKRLHLESEIAGTGLGLALCRRVALSHGGEIDVVSSLGEGSTFTIDLAKA